MLWIGAIILIGLLAIDQVSKYLIYFNPIFKENITIIPNLLEFKLYKNSGAAYGILEGEMWFFYIITILALAGLGYLYSRGNFKTRKIYTVGITFLVAGALGNAIDRVVNQFVIDFIHFPFLVHLDNLFGTNIFTFYCNPADIFLTFGIIFVLVEFLILDPIRKKKKNQEYAEKEKRQKNDEG